MTSSRLRVSLRIQTYHTMTPSLPHMRAQSSSHHTVARLAPVSQTLRMTNRYRARVSGLHRGRIRSFRFPRRDPQPSDRNLAPMHHPYSSPCPLLGNRLHPFSAPHPHLPRRLLALQMSLGDKKREHAIASHLSNVPEVPCNQSGYYPRPPLRRRLMNGSR